jgi:hypothetical protein
MFNSMTLSKSLSKSLALSITSLAWLVLSGVARAEERIDPALAKADAKDAIQWYDLRNLDVEGKGWTDTKAFYDRLPGKAEGVVRDAVWQLGRQSAGICARFVTDAPEIRARWTLTSETLGMPHMPATGVSGLDLYVKTEAGPTRWLAVGQPTAQTNTVTLVTVPAGKREYTLYLPLYNGVSSVEIGVPRGSFVGRPTPRADMKPIVFYGTSITQGGCASRPGMVHTAILGRRLNRPVINLGFSGNGIMEPEVAALLAELDPAVYVIDCLPNMSAKDVSERAEPLVRKLRSAHAKTPILLVEDRSYASSFLVAAQRKRNLESRAAFKKVYDSLISAGVQDLHYLPGENLLGSDGEATVDSSHPTDLGFMRQSDAFQAVLEPILKKAAK